MAESLLLSTLFMNSLGVIVKLKDSISICGAEQENVCCFHIGNLLTGS